MPWWTPSTRSKPRQSSRLRRKAEVIGSTLRQGVCVDAARLARRSGLRDAVIWILADCYLAGAVFTTPPVGTTASAVLVDFDVCVSTSVVLFTKRSCTALAANPGLPRRSACGSTPATRWVVD